MKEFWKRRLPALTLALLLTVGLAPPALAAHEHVFNQLVEITQTMHVWKCECGQESRGKHREKRCFRKTPECRCCAAFSSVSSPSRVVAGWRNGILSPRDCHHAEMRRF